MGITNVGIGPWVPWPAAHVTHGAPHACHLTAAREALSGANSE